MNVRFFMSEMQEGENLMQDEVSERTVTLAVRTSKMTAEVLLRALQKYSQERKQNKRYKQQNQISRQSYRGRMTIKELMQDRAGLSNIEINDENIKGFEKTARKYGIEYALKKDSSMIPPQYLVFFKGKDADVIQMAFNEYVQKRLKAEERPSVRKKIQQFRGKTKAQDREHPEKVRDKIQEKIKKREVVR